MLVNRLSTTSVALKWLFFLAAQSKCGICYDVCPSVRPSHSWVTPKWFKISKYVLRQTIAWCLWFLKTKFRIPEFKGPSRMSAACLSTVTIGPIIRHISETARSKMYYRKSHGLSVGDLEWRNGRYFDLSHRMWWFWQPTSSKWLKLEC